VQVAQVAGRVVAAAGRLAVDGHDRPIDTRGGDGLVTQTVDPGVEGGLEGVGLERHEDVSEDVLAGDAAWQVEQSSSSVSMSSLSFAQRVMAVGPAAPARTARTAITRMLDRGCRRLISDRGSSSISNAATISSSLLLELAIASPRATGPVQDTMDGIPAQPAGRKTLQLALSS
jgi:hypothetical protein